MHRPVLSQEEDPGIDYKMRLGVYMFIIYALVYSGFVLINVINPLLMETAIIFGLNLAVVYGFGLIIFALVLAIIYNHFCTKKEKSLNKDE